MKIFLILFVLALLFVIGSASMLKYIDRRYMKQKTEKQSDKEPE